MVPSDTRVTRKTVFHLLNGTRGHIFLMNSPTKCPRNNYILVVFDSCRYDSFVRARPRTIKKLGKVQKRWSYASWTSPSHYNLLIGLIPHTNPKPGIDCK